MLDYLSNKFIYTIHMYFDELNYRINENPNYDAFTDASLKTLNRCKDFCDSKECVKMIQYCVKKWNSIEEIFNKKLKTWQSIPFEDNSLLSLVSEDDANGLYTITNGINRKFNNIIITSHSWDDEWYEMIKKNLYYYMDYEPKEDISYYMKVSAMASDIIKLFDKDKNRLTDIVLSKDLEIFLDKNNTDYEIIIYDGGIGIYYKNYINSLNDNDVIDFERCIGFIEWDILDKDTHLAISRLELYEEIPDMDLDLFIHFSAACFILYNSFSNSEKNKQAWTIGARAAMIHNIINK